MFHLHSFGKETRLGPGSLVRPHRSCPDCTMFSLFPHSQGSAGCGVFDIVKFVKKISKLRMSYLFEKK